MAKKLEPVIEPAVEEVPILPGYEGDTYDEVTLNGGGPGDGTWRVVAPLPIAVTAQGAQYVISNRDAKVYTWNHQR